MYNAVRRPPSAARRSPLAAGQNEGPQGRAEHPEHFSIPFHHEAAGFTEGAEEPDVVVAVADSKRPPGIPGNLCRARRGWPH